MMQRRHLILSAGLALAAWSLPARAEDSFKIGLILPMTGPFQSTGHQIEAGVKLYMQQHGDTVAGRKIEIDRRDDTGVNP